MCIRDRFLVFPIQIVRLGDLGCAGFFGPLLGVTVHTLIEAVSYTHLRAHETVLDLVCRLLLEKNKYPTMKSSHSLIVARITRNLKSSIYICTVQRHTNRT